jgi:hypothetical protein
MARHVTSNGDSGAVHSREALKSRQDAARREDRRNGSMTRGRQAVTVREVQNRQGR